MCSASDWWRVVQRGLPAGLITFAPALTHAPDGSQLAQHVPEARVAAHVIAARGDALVLFASSDAVQIASGVHGSLAASMRFEAGAGQVLRGARACDLQPLAALLHAGLLAGAMKRSFDLTMNYANQREQFGKTIGKFQAIQQQLSVMAEHVAAAHMAAQAAFGTGRSVPALSACAVAKARTSEAAQGGAPASRRKTARAERQSGGEEWQQRSPREPAKGACHGQRGPDHLR
jgi:hypothetical protein